MNQTLAQREEIRKDIEKTPAQQRRAQPSISGSEPKIQIELIQNKFE